MSELCNVQFSRLLPTNESSGFPDTQWGTGHSPAWPSTRLRTCWLQVILRDASSFGTTSPTLDLSARSCTGMRCLLLTLPSLLWVSASTPSFLSSHHTYNFCPNLLILPTPLSLPSYWPVVPQCMLLSLVSIYLLHFTSREWPNKSHVYFISLHRFPWISDQILD